MIVLILLSFTSTLIFLDLLCKFIVEKSLTLGEERVCMGGKVFIRKVYNKGMAFNLFEEHEEAVKEISLFAVLVLVCYYLSVMLRKRRYLKKLGLSLMTAGAASNTADRCIKGHVVDYIGFNTANKKISSITFNLGDFFIAAGAVLTVCASVFHDIRKKK